MIRLERLIRTAVVAALVLLVEWLCRTGTIPASVMIAPSAMALHAADLLREGRFTHDIATSFACIAVASICAVVSGFAAGLAIHALPGVRRALEPLIASYYAVPTFAFYPVFIVLFGVGPLPIIAIATLLAIVSMMTATMTGLDRIPRSYSKTARVMRLTRWQSVWHVKLPAALPHLFSGVRLAVSHAFIGVIASEFILSGSGIGYAISYAYNNFENADMYALMLTVLVTVTVVNGVLNHIDARFQARSRR
ncbi:ABC transporter permease [Pandoraea pulmonicola]|uniref:Bicarbonate transport system permease protein CmpB n=1 Tax=Pandoraea pulmonicola TaxID=93221 RepID=A0AAJ4ZBK1_PANPU|nr:ABC transporter permease [Pandoraea pulmonicola]AJC21045.1 nitrate ABC transporter permease [Pandoraea pulmonicola]SUA90310.1 Bicarbonate transport system permease protein CmpB [Pandoraea pulmonicola]